MAFVATPQGIETVMHMVQNGVPVVNVFHFDANHSVTLADLITANANVMWFWDNSYKLQAHTSLQLLDVTSTDISVANGIQDVYVPPSTTTGVVTGDAAAANAALVVSQRTERTGRSFRGRTYLAGLAASQFADAQHLETTFVADVASGFQAFIDFVTAAGHTLSILSKYAGGVARIAGLLTEITSLIVNTVVDSQRRRTAN